MRFFPTLWAAIALASSACRPADVLPTRPLSPVKITVVGASFLSETRAELTLGLGVPNPRLTEGRAVRVSWELWLQGRWFAAGTRTLDEPLPAARTTELLLAFPMTFRPLTITHDPTPLQVGVRGSVTARFGDEEQELSFEDGRRISTNGAPLVGPADEDDS